MRDYKDMTIEELEQILRVYYGVWFDMEKKLEQLKKEGWGKMNKTQKLNKQLEVVKFFNSNRGRYIVGQALYIAIEELKTVPEPHRENSNIKDMQYLMDNLFCMYATVKRVIKNYEDKHNDGKRNNKTA